MLGRVFFFNHKVLRLAASIKRLSEGTMATRESAAARKLAQDAGEFLIGNDLRVTRLGYGAMRITGEGVWGPPKDRAEAVRVLKRAVELGINFIDTADSYGPYVSEEIIAEALYPYPASLVIATKGGFARSARINGRKMAIPRICAPHARA